MGAFDSKSRPRTQFRFKYLAVRIRLLRLGGSLTTFSTVSTQSGHRTLLCVSLSRYDVPPPRQELTKHKFLSRNNKTGLALIILNDVPIILPARWRCWAGR